ncbi:MAG: acetolactate synthase large subunit [Cypionkella sp.]|uniref:acetolactate synthase large subunit n=1 Tax=Cypionkella sp. TaxID=2811411 RepID=UPI002AB895E9|nr:acetolactate synthase large subunit [Cypionkella sp.]MDZ4310362.1 acetolactate synthase large subunit [Cypionkella sp.]MDZ4391885.1 acetolactate synthase large subunit [Cypionkella sp.]
MNGAESLVKTLLASDVEVCFANPGTSEMHFVAALDRHPEMRCILCLFEGGVSGAADGYYRMSGRVAATLLHLAPGFGNAFANLHNARKAQSGIVNVMGDHASYHLKHESPLKGDTVGISQAISHWTRVSASAPDVAVDGAAAVQAARSANGQIATLILPANTAWEEALEPAVAAAPPALRRPRAEDVQAAARALMLPGAALMVDGAALYSDLGQVAARISRASGCTLMAPFFSARSRRGAGSVKMQRLAYEVDTNVGILADKSVLVLCGTQRPTAFFAYPGKPSLPESPECRVIELCSIDMDYAWALHEIARELGASEDLPAETFQALTLPALPSGAMSLEKVGQAIAHLMPEDMVVVNEAITSGQPVGLPMVGARGHDVLVTMGGAIGQCLPAAVGAAVACPERKVLALSGDGSAMYTLQSLWTMAREGLDVCVVIFANRTYKILHGELVNVGVADVGRNVTRMFDMVEPSLDWVALAQGHGVAAVRATTADEFVSAFAGAMAKRGPFLIEVVC